MGKPQDTMAERRRNDDKNSKPPQAKSGAHDKNLSNLSEESNTCDHKTPQELTGSSTSETRSSLLSAATSSPSLLFGFSDSNTHAAAGIERHMQAHNVQINCIPNTPVTPVEQPTFSSTPFPDGPLESIFLTPSLPRSRQTSERPNSAPLDQLERISGTLLRLVGDHYLCSTCGRQLRTMGDQMALEANIRRTFSASSLEIIHNSAVYDTFNE